MPFISKAAPPSAECGEAGSAQAGVIPVNFASLMSHSVWTLSVEMHLHPWNCIKAQRKQLSWEEPGDMEPAT